MPSSWLTETDPTLKGPFAILHRGFYVPVLFLFPLNPQFFAVSSPSRGQVHQTLDSNFLDDFSGARSVLSRVVLRGTFGYNPTRGGALGLSLSGSLHLKSFEVIWETFNALSRGIKTRGNLVQEFLVPSRAIYWRVWVERLEYRTESRDPLLFYYDMTLTRLQDYLSPAGPSLPPGLVPPIVSSALSGLFGTVTSGISSAASSLAGLF